MASEKLPPFASQWAKQWKHAGPRLEAIRDEELRQTGSQPRTRGTPAILFEKYPEKNGLCVMQRWFARQQLLQLHRNVSTDDSTKPESSSLKGPQ
ncbi:hypothetical protein [Novipirellula artificiosorum]|uniref:Uncharacterized protein n=1 Tax=Novipirellula artificiosorum TaxID=2528016 RepID=A0A5C6DCC5_9BACT|nr:hypothetical protein [Novipirellula artificiosorum]TWU32589.1 hypothetical protein Poly41_55670 [Novipirellula artificiosorum]